MKEKKEVGRPRVKVPSGVMSVFCPLEVQELFRERCKDKGMTHGQYLEQLLKLDR